MTNIGLLSSIKKYDNTSIFAYLDFFVIFSLSILTYVSTTISSIILIGYCICRIVFSSYENGIYLVIMLALNINVFFISGIPVCNIIIFLVFIRIVLTKKVKRNIIAALAGFVIIAEVFHLFIYELHNILQLALWIPAFLIIPLCFNDNDKHINLEKMKLYFMFGIIISTAFGVYFRISSGKGFDVGSFNINDNNRFGGGFADPNYYSLFCLVLSAFILESLTIKKNDRRGFERVPLWLKGIVLIVLLYFCIASLSKMFIILFIIEVLMLLISLFDFSKRNLLVINSILICGIFIYVLIRNSNYDFYSLFSTLMKRFENISSLDELTTGRSNLAISAITFLMNNPLAFMFGVGVQSYGSRIGNIGYVHNYLLEIIVSFGIIGSLLFVSFFIALAIKLSKGVYNKVPLRIKYIKVIPLLIFLIGSFALNVIEVEAFYPILYLLIYNAFSKTSLMENYYEKK